MLATVEIVAQFFCVRSLMLVFTSVMELEGIVDSFVMANPCRSMEDLLKSEKLLGGQVP